MITKVFFIEVPHNCINNTLPYAFTKSTAKWALDPLIAHGPRTSQTRPKAQTQNPDNDGIFACYSARRLKSYNLERLAPEQGSFLRETMMRHLLLPRCGPLRHLSSPISLPRLAHYKAPTPPAPPTPPKPPKKPVSFTFHDETWEDPYSWMSNLSDKVAMRHMDVYMEQEEKYTEAFMSDTERLQSKLQSEMAFRMTPELSTPPIKFGPWYHNRVFLLRKRKRKKKETQLLSRKLRKKNEIEILISPVFHRLP